MIFLLWFFRCLVLELCSVLLKNGCFVLLDGIFTVVVAYRLAL